MKFKNTIALAVCSTLLLSACNQETPKIDYVETDQLAETTLITQASQSPNITETTEESFSFNPHVFPEMLSPVLGEEYKSSFFNLCDALRNGEDTFECASEDVYEWCMCPSTLTDLFPAACMWVTTGEGDEGFADGTGHICYTHPKDEFIARQKTFEYEIESIIRDNIESDYTDFEKCFALYCYMTNEYTYNYGDIGCGDEGHTYLCLKQKTGICCDLASLYSYLLLQCGVDAMIVQCDGYAYHTWTYVVLDGEGYHSDPTWGLLSEYDSDYMRLDYFLMDDELRRISGFDMDALELPIMPSMYASDYPELDLTADSNKYFFSEGSVCKNYDLEENIIVYNDTITDVEFNYGDA